MGLPVPSFADNPSFVDVSAEVGLRVITYCGGSEKNHLLESGGTGAAFGDYDGDGNLDIYIVNSWALKGRTPLIKGRNVLYRNRGDRTFEDVTARAGVGGDGRWGSGVCAADYDNDGDLDFYVTNFGPNALYRNNGDGTFTDVAREAGVADDRWGGGASFFDADNDGDLDLYVANYVECTIEDVLNAERTVLWRGAAKVMVGPVGLRGAADIFYRNTGNETFSDATKEAGLEDIGRFYGFGVCATDIDGDGDSDLYIANDSNQNLLYRNNGGGHFSEIGLWSGAGLSGSGTTQAGMGVDAGDYDNDGDLDLFVTNFAQDYSTLYRNNGGGFFEDVTEEAGLAGPTYPYLSWGTSFFDYDNDGDLDLFIANGHIYPQVDLHPELKESYAQPNLLLRNDKGAFTDVSSMAGPGLRVVKSSRGAAFGDYDNDGDLDILVTNVDATPTLLRNDGGNRGHWIELRLIGTKSNRSGIGAKVKVVTGRLTQIREVRSGSSYVSQNDLRVHVGLGTSTKADLVEIRWPSGIVNRLTGVRADRLLVVEEGSRR